MDRKCIQGKHGQGLLRVWSMDSKVNCTMQKSNILVIEPDEARADNIVWALIFNTENDNNKQVPSEVIAPQINQLADSILRWPA